MQTIIGVIPARYASSRFPGKPLVDIGGKTMIQRVYERCRMAEALTEIIVATDDERIFQAVQNFGGKVVMTSAHHISGTDRMAEVASSYEERAIFINIQGDEPFIDPGVINNLAQLMVANQAEIATAAIGLHNHDAIFDPNVVKVVFDRNGRALYFSRSPIPHQRNTPRGLWIEKGSFYKHIGIYAFRQKTLQEISKAKPGLLEQQESLEQLRWMELGYPIQILLTDHESIGIDTPEDLEKIKHLLDSKVDTFYD